MIGLKGNIEEVLAKHPNLSKKLSKRLKTIHQTAIIAAMEEATSLTPPTGDSINGANTITGTLKSAWARDSIIESKKLSDKYIGVLANKMSYASFVNDGHVMDKHFVPGLMINPFTGLLEKGPPGYEGGIMVGTKTKYVQGLNMKESAIKVYKTVIVDMSSDLLKEFNL